MAGYVLKPDLHSFYSANEFEKVLVNHDYKLVVGVTSTYVARIAYYMGYLWDILMSDGHIAYLRKDDMKVYDFTENIVYRGIIPNAHSYLGLSVDQMFFVDCAITPYLGEVARHVLYKSCVPEDFQIMEVSTRE